MVGEVVEVEKMLQCDRVLLYIYTCVHVLCTHSATVVHTNTKNNAIR